MYAVLAVMAEGTTHEVPLRLTLFTAPDLEEGAVVCNPMSAGNEWQLNVLQGFTGADGSNQLTVTPEGAAGELLRRRTRKGGGDGGERGSGANHRAVPVRGAAVGHSLEQAAAQRVAPRARPDLRGGRRGRDQPRLRRMACVLGSFGPTAASINL